MNRCASSIPSSAPRSTTTSPPPSAPTFTLRAAKLLAEQDADREAIAVHVMATDPAGIPEVVTILRAAAGRALGSGAPDTAATLLSRALAEPPREHERPLVLFELGRAEHNLGRLAAREHLLQAARTAADPVLRARALITLAVSTQPDSARQRAQLELYEQAARDVLPRPGAAPQLHGVRREPCCSTWTCRSAQDEADDYRDLPAETPAEYLLLSLSTQTLADGEDVQLVGAIAGGPLPAGVPGGDVAFLTRTRDACWRPSATTWPSSSDHTVRRERRGLADSPSRAGSAA